MDLLNSTLHLENCAFLEAGVQYRNATVEDCRQIAELYSIASDGVADYVWNTLRHPQESILDTGTRLFSELPDFNYTNTIVALLNKKLVGMILGFNRKIDETQILDEGTIDPVLLPYIKLEQVNGFYIAGVAVFPEFRGHQIGSNLLTLMLKRAVAQKCRKVSCMVFEQKGKHALRFWVDQAKFNIVGSQYVVPNEYIKVTGAVLFLIREVEDFE